MRARDMRTAAQLVGAQVERLSSWGRAGPCHAIARGRAAYGAYGFPQEHRQNRFDLENPIFGLNRAFPVDLGPGRTVPPGGGTRPGPFRLIRGGAA